MRLRDAANDMSAFLPRRLYSRRNAFAIDGGDQ